MIKEINGRILIQSSAVFLIFSVLLYTALGIVAAASDISVPGIAYYSSSPRVMVLVYGTAYLTFVAAFIGLEVDRLSIPPGCYQTLGIMIMSLSVICLLYLQIKEHKPEYFLIVSAICGIVYTAGSEKLRKENHIRAAVPQLSHDSFCKFK